MTFAWPWMLLLLLTLPVLVAGYRRMLRRRTGRRAELAALGLVAGSAGRPDRRRHIAPALFLAALTLLLLGTARPQATVTEPRREGTVVLAFDTSNSMAAKDLAPTRMEAAKKAARAFVAEQPPTIKIGVVAFGGSGFITQRPTTDHDQVLTAIGQLSPQGGTSLARGIQTSLSAIAGRNVALDDGTGAGAGPTTDPGYYSSAAVILLSDGENTDGPDPAAAADLASTTGVKVYPVGLGSPQGTVVDLDGFQVSTALDEATLKQIATTTDGKYFTAADEQSLINVYRSIDLHWAGHRTALELTPFFAAAAALLLVIGALVSTLWFGRVI